jgi:hypothetical protein
MITFQDGPAAEAKLFLQRAPYFLRVTDDGKKFDALDQPNDRPNENESLHCYRMSEFYGRAFYDGTRGGRRTGWSSMVAKYKYNEEQPPDATMRDNDLWVKWTESLWSKYEAHYASLQPRREAE